MQRFAIPGNSRRCHVSGRELGAGEEFFSAVFETVTGLVRRDYSPEHWQGPPEEAIAHWRGRLPSQEGPSKPTPLSVGEMLELLGQLGESPDPRKSRLRYVLTLLLLRRKALRLLDIERLEGEEYLIVHRPGDPARERILDPRLSLERINEVETELGSLLVPVFEP